MAMIITERLNSFEDFSIYLSTHDGVCGLESLDVDENGKGEYTLRIAA